MPEMFQRMSAPSAVPQQASGPFFAPAPQLRATIQREPSKKKRKINYANVKKMNKIHATPDQLGWGEKLETVAGGAYKSWWETWGASNHDAFADLVYDYQDAAPGLSADGELGLKTWSRIAGLGEAIAGIQHVNPKGEEVCTIASKYRIETALKQRGEKLTLEQGKSKSTYNIILQTMVGRMVKIDLEYRGTGAAGAMVYAGLATFVPEADIWTGNLRPGALIQVWGNSSDYELLRQAEIELDNGKKRPINDSDASFYGTSMVFVRYGANNEELIVRHFGRTETKNKGDYGKWVAANINTPAAPAAGPATPAAPVAEP